jgi:hypothetical protein
MNAIATKMACQLDVPYLTKIKIPANLTGIFIYIILCPKSPKSSFKKCLR